MDGYLGEFPIEHEDAKDPVKMALLYKLKREFIGVLKWI